MKKTNQVTMLIFSILLILLFVSCPGATGVMYSLTLNASGATEKGTTVLYYSSIEDAWYGDVNASQRATKIAIPEKKYTVKFMIPGSSEALSSQDYIEKFNGYNVGGVAVVDGDGNILDSLKPTKNMTAVVSWNTESEVVLPELDLGDNVEFIGWKEDGAQDDSAKKSGETYTPNSPSTTLISVSKNTNQYRITLDPGANVTDENKGTTEIWYNAYNGKFYNAKSKDPKNPIEAEDENVENFRTISTITIPRIIRTIKYNVNPDNAPDIDISSPKDLTWNATFKGYGTLIDSNGAINQQIITGDVSHTALWGESQPVKLDDSIRDEVEGYTFLGWKEADGTEIRLGSSEFQAYTPKLENNELKAIWVNGKTYTLNLSHGGATSKKIDSLYFKVANSGRGGTWFKEYGNDESVVESLSENELPQKVSAITLDLQKGEFISPPEEGEDDIDRSLTRSVKWDFDGYFVMSGNGVQAMVINPKGEFKDESGELSAIYGEKSATAKWSGKALSLPTSEVLKRSGYTLSGWKDNKGNVHTESYIPTSIIETLTAVWTPNVYTLKLNLNENEFTKRGDVTVYYRTDDRWYAEYSVDSKKDANRVITCPERIYSVTYNTKHDSVTFIPSKAEYKFQGYFDANDESICYIDANGKIVADKIITENSDKIVEANGKWADANVALPLPNVSGYDFNGWKEGDSESYPILQSPYNPVRDITLYADWKETNYKATLEYGNGCGDEESIATVENIALNNGDGATITIRLTDYNAKFSSLLGDDDVSQWFFYENEQGVMNDFGSNLSGRSVTIKNGGAGYDYATVLIKGSLVLPKMETPVVYSTNIVIPRKDIVSNYSENVTIPMKYQVKYSASVSIDEDPSLVGTVSYPLMGGMNERLGDKLTGSTMIVRLTNAVFSSTLTQEDVENWFEQLSIGLGGKDIKYRIDEGGASSSYVKVIISGVPSQRERGSRDVAIPFKDIKGGSTGASTLTVVAYYDTKYFQKAFEIELTSSEQQNAKSDWRGEVKDQNMSFIFLPGGNSFEWPVVWTQNAITSPIAKASIREDFAISDIEVTSGFFMTVKEWAEKNGYKFNFGESESSRMPRFKLGYNDTSKDKNSSLDPVVGVSWYNAIVFCNAVTEWYNAVKNQGTPLTCAYVVGGDQGGTPLRDATNTLELDNIDPKQHLPLTGSYYSHVVGSTGFRLPTRAEWQYAASVSPKKVNEEIVKKYVGIALPDTFFAQAYDTTSVGDAVFSSEETKVVGKYRGTNAKTNSIGLYDMSGNAFEWSEDMEAIGYRYVNGGAWNTEESKYPIGSYVSCAPSLSSNVEADENNTGFRLCRNIFNNF